MVHPAVGPVQMTVPGLRERVIRARERERKRNLAVASLVAHPSDSSDDDNDADADADNNDNGADEESDNDDLVDLYRASRREEPSSSSSASEMMHRDVLDVLGRFADFGAVRRAAGGVPVDVDEGRGSSWLADADGDGDGVGEGDLRGEMEARLNRSESVSSRVSARRARI